MQPLKEQLDACLRMLDCSRTTNKGDKNWLNVSICIYRPLAVDCIVFFFQEFCAKFLTFASNLQICINKQLEHETVEIICLCLTQILICVRQLECTIQTEEASGLRIHVGPNSIRLIQILRFLLF